MDLSPLLIYMLVLIVIVWLAAITWQVSKLSRRFKAALGNTNSTEKLENTLVNYFKKLNITEEKINEMIKRYKNLSHISTRSFQKLGLVRFNPFRDTGGDQSFALCLLDGTDTGIVITAVHGREGTRVYAKPITYGTCDYSLSAEEKTALKEAIKQK